MKKANVKVGGTYAAKVTNKVVPVRIDAENPRGGWDATNQATGKKVRIKSAQRLRGPWPKKAAKATKDAKKATKRDPKPVPGSARAGQKGTGQRTATGGEREAKPMSLLDAAAHLLSLGTGDPMRCKDIVDLAVARGLWTPGDGKTPANTLYASILREIKTKGEDSRFDKVDRGKFAAVAGKQAK